MLDKQFGHGFAVDSTGATIDFLLSAKRDAPAAEREDFLRDQTVFLVGISKHGLNKAEADKTWDFANEPNTLLLTTKHIRKPLHTGIHNHEEVPMSFCYLYCGMGP